MLIRKFEERDIFAASQMIHSFWGDELDGQSEEFKKFVQEYMIKYHQVNRDYSLCLEVQQPQGFILASLPTEESTIGLWCQEQTKNFSAKEQHLAQEYRNYFEQNSEVVKQYMGHQDLLVHLFMSKIKGGGTILLEKLMETCRQQSLENLYLWTDTTCNHEYYEYNGFAEVESWNYTTDIYDPKEVKIMVYRKQVDLFSKLS